MAAVRVPRRVFSDGFLGYIEYCLLNPRPSLGAGGGLSTDLSKELSAISVTSSVGKDTPRSPPFKMAVVLFQREPLNKEQLSSLRSYILTKRKRESMF